MAIGAMAAIEEAGLHIPEDVAVVGFDDCEYAAITTPRLTSVRQDLIGLGTASVEAILRMLDAPEDPPPSSVLPVELIVRESTAPPSSPPSDRLTPVSRRQADRFEISSVPATAESASRLSPAALCRLLGDDDSAPRGRPGETSERTDTQKWHADRRRLVAVALDTAPDQSFRHAFFDELFYEIRARAYARGFDLVVITNVGTLPGEPFPPFLELCEKYRADGLLIISLPVESPPVAALSKSNFPCATLDVDLLNDTTAFVMSDNIGGGVKAVHHLIETGCHRIAFIGGSGDERPNVDRRFGYQSELARCGVPYSEEYVAMANWLPDRAFEATLTCLALPEPPDAIFCASDVMAIGAMAAIEEAGLRIPEDVAIVGFDDIDYARLVAPSLTTVRQSQDALAEGLIDGMLRLIEQPDETPQVSIVPVDLIVRDSTSGVPTHEPV
jgi:LacI family transcriptional regulator